MTTTDPVQAEVSKADLEKIISKLQLELEEAKAQVVTLQDDLAATEPGAIIADLRHQLLIARDHAIGCEAAAGTAQAEVRKLEQLLADAHKEIKWMRESWRWRIGGYAVAPIRALKQAAK